MSSFFTVLDHVSSGASASNEDVIAYKSDGQTLDIWVIDGATSVADREFLGLEISDPAWFAQSVSSSFKNHTAAGILPPAAVSASIKEVTSLYEQKTPNQEIPLYAKPLAAMLWIRVRRESGQTALDLWSLGDCRMLAQSQSTPSLLLFPAMTRGDVAPHAAPALSAETGPEARNRTGVLLSHALSERKIREAKHTDPTTARLGFHPDSILYATKHAAKLTGPCTIVAMSDGFYRLVDEYGLYSDTTLLDACRSKGLQALVAELRAYEASRDMSQAVKKSDDATAIVIHISG